MSIFEIKLWSVAASSTWILNLYSPGNSKMKLLCNRRWLLISVTRDHTTCEDFCLPYKTLLFLACYCREWFRCNTSKERLPWYDLKGLLRMEENSLTDLCVFRTHQWYAGILKTKNRSKEKERLIFLCCGCLNLILAYSEYFLYTAKLSVSLIYVFE